MTQVRIDSIAAGGDGVGRLDGLAVFVPRTAPGELVEASVQQRGRMARGRLLRVIEPSPERVAPECRHYDGDRCGGCQLQHMSLSAQHAAKRRIVRDAFARIAKRDVDVPELVESPSAWHYRSRLTLAMRWKGGHWVMGLHAYDEVDRVFGLRECPITEARVVDAWREVQGASRHLPRVPELRGTIRTAGEDLVLVLEGGDAWPQVRDFASAAPSLTMIRWRPAHGAPRTLLDRRNGVTPEESFDQVNQPVAAAARQEIVERAMAMTPTSAVDAYSGLGVTARALAERGVNVTAIEFDDAAVRYAGAHLPATSRAIAAKVEDVITSVLPADVVILNPPRAGVDPAVTTALNAVPPKKLLYMSCDPATLARDVARLGGYRVNSLRAYDMFPQTAHVEVVCELSPEAH